MSGLNKQAHVVRSGIGWAAVSMAPLMNKCETVSTVLNKHPVCVYRDCNGISYLALCGGYKVSLNVSMEERHVDNEAMTAQCQQQPWTSTGPTVPVTPAAVGTCVDRQTFSTPCHFTCSGYLHWNDNFTTLQDPAIKHQEHSLLAMLLTICSAS